LAPVLTAAPASSAAEIHSPVQVSAEWPAVLLLGAGSAMSVWFAVVVGGSPVQVSAEWSAVLLAGSHHWPEAYSCQNGSACQMRAALSNSMAWACRA